MLWFGFQIEDVLKGFVKKGKKNILLVFIVFIFDYIEIFYELDIEYVEEVVYEVRLLVYWLFVLLIYFYLAIDRFQ